MTLLLYVIVVCLMCVPCGNSLKILGNIYVAAPVEESLKKTYLYYMWKLFKKMGVEKV